MDWKIFAATFSAVFLAEMGDKTQLATMTLATGPARWSVFAGAALALIATTLVAVLLGDAVSRFVSPVWLKRGAGAIFLVMGLVYLFASAD